MTLSSTCLHLPRCRFVWGRGILLASFCVNICIVSFAVHGAARRDQIDVATVHELIVPMTLTVILSFTNLETLSVLPWVFRPDARGVVTSYAGFPTRGLMLLTIVSVFLEDIPQISIQASPFFSSCVP